MNKKKIIEIGLKMLKDGLVASTWGNVSMLENEGNLLITPSGIPYDELAEEDLVLMDFSGVVLEGKRKPSSEYLLHSEIYQKRKDVKAIIHTHSLYASAYAVVGQPIPALIEDAAMVVGGRIEIAEYALPGTRALADNAAMFLADRNAVLLANHGLVSVGDSLEEAYKIALLVEKMAHIGVAAKSLGDPKEISEADVKYMCEKYKTCYGQKIGG